MPKNSKSERLESDEGIEGLKVAELPKGSKTVAGIERETDRLEIHITVTGTVSQSPTPNEE